MLPARNTGAPRTDKAASVPVKTLPAVPPKARREEKDAESRLVWASPAMLPRCGVRVVDELIGRTDYDFFSKQNSDNFVRDDRTVVRTGQPILRRAEIFYTKSRTLEWTVTSKFPVRDRQGKVIGVIGMVENSPQTMPTVLQDPSLSRALEHIRQRHRASIPSEELAAAAGLSPRHLLRRFREEFGLSPQEFAHRARLHAACDALLHREATVASVAAEFGFCDQSAFTRQFRQVIGLTPMAYQREYGQRREAEKRAKPAPRVGGMTKRAGRGRR